MAEKTKIPPGPWTVEALGEELYATLAIENEIFNPRLERNFRPPLDLVQQYKAQEAAKAKAPKAEGGN